MLFYTITILCVYHKIILCLVVLYCNITMSFCMLQHYVLYLIMLYCNVILLFEVLQFCFVSSDIVLSCYIVILYVTMLFCVLSCRFVMLQYCCVSYDVDLCLVLLFCNDAALFYNLQYVLRLIMLVYNVIMLFCILLCCLVML